MGNVPTRAKATGEREGCWYTRSPYGSGNPLKNLGALFFSRLLDEDRIDCDCHLRGTCMPGEPPLPPMDEFIMDLNLNPGWEAKPAHHVKPKIPNAHTYRPKEWTPDVFQYYPSGPKIPPIGKRGLETLEPEFERPVPFSNKAVPSRWKFPTLVIQAFHALPGNKQKAVLDKWPDFEPFTEDLPQSFEQSYFKIDPRPSLAILLGDPRGRAGDAVRAMDSRYADLVLQCANEAMTDMLNMTMQALDKKPKSGENVDADELTIKQLQYLEVFKHYAVLWNRHVPIDPDWGSARGGDTFDIQVKNGNGKDVEVITANEVCTSVTEGALSNIREHDSYVADFDDIMGSLDQQMKLGEGNSFIEAMQLSDTLAPMTQDLDWKPQTIAAVFGSSMPGLQVAMSYFALSLWVGVGTSARLG
ncbi:hypothetical protein G7Z17_g11138 [Cylindrodendrum hubeiense]|uniref:Uncharacterized protein n=1 Tax=Cylindrodendrum hubeiense TaxID=595255 RepID=A0A9P5LBM4_9HYPO|nr:hypothetical protein G7Z17_g11138 [Cylindrodendrum hubeiense]